MRSPKPPLPKGGGWRSQTGGIKDGQVSTWVHPLQKVPAVKSLSHGCAVPAPFPKGAFSFPLWEAPTSQPLMAMVMLPQLAIFMAVTMN